MRKQEENLKFQAESTLSDFMHSFRLVPAPAANFAKKTIALPSFENSVLQSHFMLISNAKVNYKPAAIAALRAQRSSNARAAVNLVGKSTQLTKRQKFTALRKMTPEKIRFRAKIALVASSSHEKFSFVQV